jgi:hypothetical protein
MTLHQGTRTEVAIALGHSEFEQFTTLRPAKMREIFFTDEKLAAADDQLCEVLKTNFAFLKSVYRHYAPGQGGR